MSTDAVHRTGAAANYDQELVTRYTFGERVNHWFGSLTYIYLLITGLAFWSPYLYWLAAVVGGGSAARNPAGNERDQSGKPDDQHHAHHDNQDLERAHAPSYR